MTVSSVNYNLGASWGAYSQKLTSATKAKLEELGIPYNSEMSEAEGKKLIQTVTAQQSSQKQGSFSQNSGNSNSLFEKARALAQKLGIAVDENVNFEALLAAIEAKIEQRLEVSKNDEAALKELRSLSQELAGIQAESKGSSGYDNTNRALMESLEMLAQYNKNYLNR